MHDCKILKVKCFYRGDYSITAFSAICSKAYQSQTLQYQRFIAIFITEIYLNEII